MPNNDLISRDAAIAELEQWAEHGYDVIHWTGIKVMLENQPAVDAAPVRHGRWTDRGSLSCRCSCCGCKSNAEYNYCPHCGARMDGGEDDEAN